MLVKNSIREKTIYININVPLVEWNPAEKMSLMTRLTVEAAAVDVEALPMPYRTYAAGAVAVVVSRCLSDFKGFPKKQIQIDVFCSFFLKLQKNLL